MLASPRASPSTSSPTSWSELTGVASGVGYYAGCGVFFDPMSRGWDEVENATGVDGAFVIHTPGRRGVHVLRMRQAERGDGCVPKECETWVVIWT